MAAALSSSPPKEPQFKDEDREQQEYPQPQFSKRTMDLAPSSLSGGCRRARVVVASLGKTGKGSWGDVKSIKTWKRVEDQHLTGIDGEVLWSKGTSGRKMITHMKEPHGKSSLRLIT